jgi:hypothetical protein
MITNKQIAIEHLNYALKYPNSEIGINNYIRFMDSLPEYERKEILLSIEITELIDKINGYVDNEIELNKIHEEGL